MQAANKNLAFSPLSPEQVNAVKNFEKEFASRFGNNVFLLAFNQNQPAGK